MIVCVHLPRFELQVAAGGARALAGRPVALAPAPGRQAVGATSGAAEAQGVRAGMALGEALARCRELVLVPGDPLGVAEAWETHLRALEGIGAAVEPAAEAGIAYLDARPISGIHGGGARALHAVARATGQPARLGLGPTRFCALAGALSAHVRRPVTVSGPRDLHARPIQLLAHRPETQPLVTPLQRLGIRTLGELAALPRPAIADRFGEPGLLAHRLAHGRDTPLRPRTPRDRLRKSIRLPEAASGPMLEHALGLLIDRLLADPARHGRTLRAVILAARLADGAGTWRERAVLRAATADGRRMRLALAPRLALLPAPADSLSLTAEDLDAPAPDQAALLPRPRARRLRALHEAVRQVRAVAGPTGALKILEVDPGSRVPERRLLLTPFEDGR